MNFASQTVWTGDNLEIMRGMNSDCVDLIYLDPPFNSKANYAAPIGSQAAGAAFKDTWTLDDVEIAWIDMIQAKNPALQRVLLAAMTDSDKAYLAYMAIRLLEMKRILKPEGSIYLHCDPTMSHYLKLVMDAVFGRANFRNEIVWSYAASPSAVKKDFPRKHDTILRYGATADFIFNADAVRIPYSESSMNRIKYGANKSTIMAGTKIKLQDKGKIPPSVWTDIVQVYRKRKERTGYPTQKPIALLKRILAASSNPGDMVLDPFCGCATACIAAESLQREWVGIDISSKAAELVRARMDSELGMLYQGIHRTDIPARTDLGKLPKYNCSENKHHLYGQQAGVCHGCNTNFLIQNFHVDHIIPKSKGGTDHMSNLQLLCGHCNSVKGNRGMEYLKAKLQIGASA